MLRRILKFLHCERILEPEPITRPEPHPVGHTAQKPQKKDKLLYVFDFDQTILKFDSEVAISNVIKTKVPDNIIQFYTMGNWAGYCQGLIDHVILTDKVPLDEIVKSIQGLELTPGMDKLLHKIRSTTQENPGCHFLIISGSNNFFVQCVLSNLDPPVLPQAIISNKATRIAGPPEPRLVFEPYELQYDCRRCPKNLCKGNNLMKYAEQNGPFKTIYYVGDGPNDVCPMLRLGSQDTMFVRKDHVLEKIIQMGSFLNMKLDIKAKIVYFDTGEDIENVMEF